MVDQPSENIFFKADPPTAQLDTIPADPLGIFGRYLTVWVALSCGVGVLIGHFAPSVPEALNKASVSQISVPVAVLIWLIVLPMVVQIDVKALVNVWENKRPIGVTSAVNYLIQPFTMYGLAWFFFRVVFSSVIDDVELEDSYLAGAVILGGSPCTAMVFVWSFLTNGDPAYTLVQVVFNDLLIFVFYVPTLMMLLQVTDISVPWDTAFLSVALFLLVPGILALGLRWYALRHRSREWLDRLVNLSKPVSMVALLGTIVLIFIFQGSQIVRNPVHVLLIAVPLTLNSYGVFVLAYYIMYLLRVPFRFAAPGALIATSNFFELAVAVAMSLFGADSGATLTTVVGVLVEVPVMLSLVWLANRTRHYFPMSTDTQSLLKHASKEFDRIPEDRQALLQSLAAHMQQALDKYGAAKVTFICTHNSRRSQFCEAWLRAAALFYRIPAVAAFSGGTEVTCMHPHTVKAIRRAGFRVRKLDSDQEAHAATENPHYVCLPRGGSAVEAVDHRHMFSKRFDDAKNPNDDFIAVLACDAADAACPVVCGASHRVALPYQDPKASDDTPQQLDTYDATCLLVAREMLYVVSRLHLAATQHSSSGLPLCARKSTLV